MTRTRAETAEVLATIVAVGEAEHGARVARGLRSLCTHSEMEGLGTATDTGFVPHDGQEYEVFEHWIRIMDASRSYGRTVR